MKLLEFNHDQLHGSFRAARARKLHIAFSGYARESLTVLARVSSSVFDLGGLRERLPSSPKNGLYILLKKTFFSAADPFTVSTLPTRS